MSLTLYDQFGKPLPRGESSGPSGWGRWRRRWEGAETDRLNEAHWAGVQGRTINGDLELKLKTLRQRLFYELANNALLRGMVRSFQADVVGPHGPTLELTGENDAADRYARTLEDLWGGWWKMPDFKGQRGGPEVLKQQMYMLLPAGDFFERKRNADGRRRPTNDTPIRLRLQSIHPRRLDTPPTRGANGREVVLGVEVDEEGIPTAYWVDRNQEFSRRLTRNFQRIEARNVIHGYEVDEPDQIRGVPWMASALPVLADLRDYDAEVLEAARQAAQHGVTWFTDHEDVEPFQGEATKEIERGQHEMGPPGWKPMQLQPGQPKDSYPEYRKERARDLGRPISMPGMVVRQDASDSSFSSSRMVGQMYENPIRSVRGWLQRIELDPLLADVEREGRLAGELPTQRPGQIRARWVWPPTIKRSADPDKESRGAERRLKTRISTLADELADSGQTVRGQIREIQRIQREFEEAGLEVPTFDDGGGSEGGGRMADWVNDAFRQAIEEYEEERTPA